VRAARAWAAASRRVAARAAARAAGSAEQAVASVSTSAARLPESAIRCGQAGSLLAGITRTCPGNDDAGTERHAAATAEGSAESTATTRLGACAAVAVVATPPVGDSRPPARMVKAITAATRTATMASLRESRDGEVTTSTVRPTRWGKGAWGSGKWRRSPQGRALHSPDEGTTPSSPIGVKVMPPPHQRWAQPRSAGNQREEDT
jgi:hypothetical protein